MMDELGQLVEWAWARHHNPLSWYIRPLFAGAKTTSAAAA